MKKFISFLLGLVVIMAASLPAMAWETSNTVKPFSNYSTSSGSAVYSRAYDCSNFRQKGVIVQGIAVAGHAATTLSGTLLAQCAPTATGPWQTCGGLTGTAISTTSNAALYWMDPFPFVRFSWTKTSGEVSVYFSLGN